MMYLKLKKIVPTVLSVVLFHASGGYSWISDLVPYSIAVRMIMCKSCTILFGCLLLFFLMHACCVLIQHMVH